MQQIIRGVSCIAGGGGMICICPHHHLRRRRPRLAIAACSTTTNTNDGEEQNHYAVLGLCRAASRADIKRGYRLLARKYHPDVTKNSQSAEVFKRIRLAYEVLSNYETKTRYDQALKYEECTGRHRRGDWNYDTEFEDTLRPYRWADLNRRMRHKRHEEQTVDAENDSPFDSGKDEMCEEEKMGEGVERGSFMEVLRSAFLSLFLMQTVGCQLSLTFSSLMALVDRKLDGGYRVGYLLAWVLGGRGGILLTLCLSFASWICGKSSSGLVAVVVVALWFGSNLGKYVQPPQGALLTLLYMSIKLQVDLK